MLLESQFTPQKNETILTFPTIDKYLSYDIYLSRKYIKTFSTISTIYIAIVLWESRVAVQNNDTILSFPTM